MKKLKGTQKVNQNKKLIMKYDIFYKALKHERIKDKCTIFTIGDM